MVKKKEDSLWEFRNTEPDTFDTIKVPLKSVLLTNSVMGGAINALCLEVNDLVIHAYQFIRLYLITLYSENKPFPTLDDNFIASCIRVLGSVKRDIVLSDSQLMESLQTFYKNDYKPLVSHVFTDLSGKTQLRKYLSTEIITCMSNNVQEHFGEHFRRFVNLTMVGVEKSTMNKLKHQLMMLDNKSDSSEIVAEQNIINAWKATHLVHLFPIDVDKSVYYDLKKSPLTFLKGMLYMNKILEESNHKLFQPLPLRTNVIPKHIRLDTVCLIELFLPNLKTDSFPKITELKNNVNKNKDLVWGSLLNLKHPVFKRKNHCFNHQIQTDGVSCSLLFIRKEQASRYRGTKTTGGKEQVFTYVEQLDTPILDSMKGRNIVGCDPGKMSLVYMVDENGNKLQYTAHQRKIESYAKCNTRIINDMRKRYEIHDEEAVLARLVKSGECSSTTVNVAKFRKYLVEKTKMNAKVEDFYAMDTFRKMSFRQYCYATKSLDNFLNRIEEKFGKDCVIGYGDWSENKPMANFMPTMGKGLRRAVHKRFDTVTINEHKTSMLCCDCSQPLAHVKDKKGEDIYRLFCCVSCKNKETVFRTRDVNAAVNIRKLTREWIDTRTRPIEFIRPDGSDGYVKTKQPMSITFSWGRREPLRGNVRRSVLSPAILAGRSP